MVRFPDKDASVDVLELLELKLISLWHVRMWFSFTLNGNKVLD